MLAAPFPVGAGEGDAASWDRYVPGAISEVIDSQTALVCDGATPAHPVWTIAGEDYARKALLTYTGLSRPTGVLQGEMLSNWLTSLDLAPEVADAFEREYLFHEKTHAYWLPVQSPVAGYFSTELNPNDPVLLYVVWAGAHCTGDRVIWLFLVNEFESLELVPSATGRTVT